MNERERRGEVDYLPKVGGGREGRGRPGTRRTIKYDAGNLHDF